MKFVFSLLMIFLLIKLILSDLNSGNQKNFKNLEKKAKVLSCTYLSKLLVDSMKDYDKILKDIIKDETLDNNEKSKKERVTNIMLVNCYLKITKELANNIILEITKGDKDIIKKKEYYELFEMNKNKDMNNIKETMKEITEILKEIKEEEELFKKRKDSPDFEKAYKEFEEKMKNNKNNYKKKTTNEKEQNNKKKKKKSGKKPYEGTKWEVVKPSGDNLFEIRDIIDNPSIIFELTGINTFCGMVIMALIIINIYQSNYNLNRGKENKINENKENEKDINKINNIKKDEEEEEKEEKEEIIEKEIENNDEQNIIENDEIKNEEFNKNENEKNS